MLIYDVVCDFVWCQLRVLGISCTHICRAVLRAVRGGEAVLVLSYILTAGSVHTRRQQSLVVDAI